MPLGGQEKGELERQIQLLVELDEPEALLATLARAVRRMAQGLEPPESRKRWLNLANALVQAETALNAMQTPEARKLEEHMAEWPPVEARPEGETS
jgi:hypothetical protein